MDKGAPLGTMMKGQSRTIKGLMSTISSIPDNWFGKLVPDDLTGFNAKEFPAFVALKKLLENLVDAFDPSSSIGKKVQDRARKMLNVIFGSAFQGAAAATNPEFILKIFDVAEKKLLEFESWVKSKWPVISKTFVSGLEDMSLIIKTIAGGLREIGKIKGLFDQDQKRMNTAQQLSQEQESRDLRNLKRNMEHSTPMWGIPWLRIPMPDGGGAGNGPGKPGGPMRPVSYMTGSLGGRGNRGNLIAQKAVQGLEAGWAESAAGFCSRWVRQVFAQGLGGKTGKLFGGNAIQSEKLWQQAGLTRSLEQLGGTAGLRPGDVLFQGYGSRNKAGVAQGHTGIYLGNGMVGENTQRYGARGDHRAATPLSQFGGISSVGRADGFGPAAAPPVRPAAPPRTTTGGQSRAPVVNINFVQKPGENDHQAAERLARMAVDRMLAQLEQHGFEDGEYV